MVHGKRLRLDRSGTSTSAPQIPQGNVPVEHGKHQTQPGFELGRNCGKLPEYMSQKDIFHGTHPNHKGVESSQPVQTIGIEGSQDKGRSSHNPGYRGKMEPEGAYCESSRLTQSIQTRLPRASHHY
ncbi:hypothetical protein O181_027711 [Austropuccinia psidii MF-1]|uniref:Uncharacterized protein n=1 Tax=Austropuccinia psidii MF-1 TaxID=1389203 RepID=A0A9Q3CMU6_9BASI|nr:hypothetical protein [Austropuccinia psidii MF-1]